MGKLVDIKTNDGKTVYKWPFKIDRLPEFIYYEIMVNFVDQPDFITNFLFLNPIK